GRLVELRALLDRPADGCPVELEPVAGVLVALPRAHAERQLVRRRDVVREEDVARRAVRDRDPCGRDPGPGRVLIELEREERVTVLLDAGEGNVEEAPVERAPSLEDV